MILKYTFSLRQVLLLIYVSLLIVTVSSIALFSYWKGSQAVETGVQKLFTGATRAAQERVANLMSAAPMGLREYGMLAQRNLLPIDNHKALGLFFAERLRQNLAYAWVGFGDARTGEYIGATRRDGEIRVYSARPKIDGGMPVESHIESSGLLRAGKSVENSPYRVTEKGWFKQGMANQGVSWLPPHKFTSGQLGVSIVMPLVLPGSKEPVGVFHVDMFMDSLEEFLDKIDISKNGRVYLMDQSGVEIVSQKLWRSGDPALAAAISLPNWRQHLDTESVEVLPYQHAGKAWYFGAERIHIPDSPGVILGVIAPGKDFTGDIEYNALAALVFGLAALIVGTLALIFYVRRVTEPLQLACDELDKLGMLIFDDRSVELTSSVREIAVVNRTANHMRSSLRSFSRYVPIELVREFINSGRAAELGGERRRLTIQFSDIKGFSGIAEKLKPEELVAEMSDYFSTVSGALRNHRGTIGQIYGDGILAFFNAPEIYPDHEASACRAALEVQQLLKKDRATRREAGRPEFSVRIGLEVGEVIVGNIGTADRFAYNVIGDAVNLASRLEGLCKYYGTAIIATCELKMATGANFEWRHLDRVKVVGRLSDVDIYELLSVAGDLSAQAAARRDAFEVALADYFAGRFAEAAEKFSDLRNIDGDLPATIFTQRCEGLLRDPPRGDWSGVYSHASK